MAVHAYLLAVLVVSSIGGTAEVLPQPPQDALVSAPRVLADIRQVHVVLATQETGLIDAPSLKAQIVQKLGEAGVKTVEQDTETIPRLVVHIEGVDVPGSDSCVCRVQTALERLVTVPELGNYRLQTEVWRVRPVLQAVAKAEADKAISSAVLVQVDAFVDAHKAAGTLRDLTEDVEVPSRPGLQVGTEYPYSASKTSSVFHLADCRSAQNISADNRVGYRTREEAVQSGKRPCKLCQP